MREAFPSAHLTYVVEPAAADVVARNPHIDELIVAPRRRSVAGAIAELALVRRLRARRYDLAIDFHGGPRASILAWLSGAQKRIGYNVIGRSWMYTQCVARPRALRPRHSVENQWDLLTPLGIRPPDMTRFPVEMPVDPAVAERVETRLRGAGVRPTDRVVVVHVSSNSPFRRWPAPSFVSTIVALARGRENRRVVVTSGPSEADAAERIIEEAHRLSGEAANRVLRCGEFSLAELRALVNRAALYIGGDTGPLHIAATSAAPIVGLFGPTLPVRSSPWRRQDHPTIAIDAGPLPCRPCNQRACEPGDFRCLTLIEPARVVAAAEQLLAAADSKTVECLSPALSSER